MTTISGPSAGPAGGVVSPGRYASGARSDCTGVVVGGTSSARSGGWWTRNGALRRLSFLFCSLFCSRPPKSLAVNRGNHTATWKMTTDRRRAARPWPTQAERQWLKASPSMRTLQAMVGDGEKQKREACNAKPITPLPRLKVAVLCGLVACAMFSFAVIYPFLPFLVGWCECRPPTPAPPQLDFSDRLLCRWYCRPP